jgi:C-methyltransferase
MTAAPPQPPPPDAVLSMMQGLQASAILQAGVELGVFDAIAAGTADARGIAASTGASERGTRILLDALAALGLLERAGETYELAPQADAYLVSGRPAYLGGMVRIICDEWAWAGFARLGEAVRRGGSLLDDPGETPEHAFWETFASASVGMSTPAAHALADVLGPWAAAREPLEILDVACGSGLYSLTLAERHEHARVSLLDWSNVLDRTRETVERLGLQGRTRTIDGDVFEVPLGGPYDLIVASHIFHHFSEERCLTLLERLAAALKPDGRLAINEFVPGERPAEEPFPHLFSVIMLTWTREGEAYPLETYVRLLEAAGFASPEVHDGVGLPSRFLIATPRGGD